MKFCPMFPPPEPKSWRRYCSKLYCKWGYWLCFQKNLWKFKQILKILFKIFFESFKENVNKHFEKLNENYNFLLLSILIAGWGLGCSPSFASVPGFREGEASPFPPRLRHWCTLYRVYNETSQFSQFPIQCK